MADVNRRLEACAAREKAAELYRLLAREDTVCFRPKFVDSLNRWVTQLVYAGRYEDALAPAQECVELCRAFAVGEPEHFIRKLALSWGALGSIYSSLNRRQDAVAAAAEAIRALFPEFHRLREPLVPDMNLLLRDYIDALLTAKAEPDMELMRPVMELLKQLHPELFVHRVTAG